MLEIVYFVELAEAIFWLDNIYIEFTIYSPPTKLWEGNAVSSVCLSFCSRRGPHLTTSHDAIGQSQVASVPPIPVLTLPAHMGTLPKWTPPAHPQPHPSCPHEDLTIQGFPLCQNGNSAFD